MPDISVLIPARNEEWLAQTVTDVLEHLRGDTEVIVVLDGQWANPPLPQHPRLQVVYLPEAIGQRAATNLAARISTATYVAKCDAHVSVSEGFDVELMRAAEQLGPDVTQIPAQKNLHVYDQVCDACGARTDQAPHLQACAKCGGTLRKHMVWKPRGRRHSTSWVFSPEPKFGYDRDGERRQTDDICDVMTSLGAFFFMRRDRFWELGGLDESYGSWGSFGIEVACKSWLSGGRHVVNKRAWFAHFFRVGGIGFPYEISGAQQDAAKQRARDVWFNNAWPKQTRPLSWLIEKFWPVPGWSDADRALVANAPFIRNDSGDNALPVRGVVPTMPSIETDSATPMGPLVESVRLSGESVPFRATCLSAVDGTESGRPQHVLPGRDKREVSGIAATGVVASDVVDLLDVRASSSRNIANQPSEQKPMREVQLPAEDDLSVSALRAGSLPYPATGRAVDDYLSEDARQRGAVEMRNGEVGLVSHAEASHAAVGLGAADVSPSAVPLIIPPRSARASVGIVAYTDSQLDPVIDRACRHQLRRAADGMPIMRVALGELKPVGDRPPRDPEAPKRVRTSRDQSGHIVLQLPRGPLTMFRQILKGLEALDVEIVFFAEHDCLYPADHLAFRPSKSDRYFYQTHVWKVDSETGRALHYLCEQTSGLCADRELLLEHYRQRVARVEALGFDRRMGFEPGKPIRHGGIDDIPRETWHAARPLVDIRHTGNLTPSRWRRDEFRNQRYTAGWTEADEIPGWGRTAGRFSAWLDEVTR